MMEVQKYLKENSLQKLIEEFKIDVTDYEDRVVLNYNQIESPRFHPIVDECRALILKKNTWEVMARSFDRFYNFNESVEQKILHKNPFIQKISSFKDEYKEFPFLNCSIEEKLDGSILTLYHDGEKWCASTRKRAFAEGSTELGRTFSEIFFSVANKKPLLMKELSNNHNHWNQCCFFFELTGPENRVVKPYVNADITLIGARYLSDENHREFTREELLTTSILFDVKRPSITEANSLQELLNIVENLNCMDEGFVLVSYDKSTKKYWRVKLKNSKFVAIANMRANGSISPKRILKLIMSNDHHEYLKYFEQDKKYFDFVEEIYYNSIERIRNIFEENNGICNQKDFALSIMEKTKYSFEKGVIFSLRKNKTTIREEISKIEPKKIAESMNLKYVMNEKFHINID